MTEERLALSELLEKSGEGDFLRAVAEGVLQFRRLRSKAASSNGFDSF